MKFTDFSDDFNEDNFKSIIEGLNTGLKRLTLEDNLSGQVANITIEPNSVAEVSHNLKVTPKYRIILRQEGNAVVTDGNQIWTSKFIYLKNNSLTDTIVLTVLILRG